METQFDNTHNTCAVELDDVRVPVRNLIGQEGMGFGMTMTNFNHVSSLAFPCPVLLSC
jgi:alkylation response protein AidB-like acyl-CoA dehydrogenase